MDYIAPERIRNQDSKAAGDLFSLGVTLYQAVTGVTPFHRDTVAASLAAILFDQPPPPRCQAALATLIMRLLAKDPRQRPTIPVARGLLATLLTAGPTPAPVQQRPTPTRVETAPKLKPTRIETVQRPANVAPAPKRPPVASAPVAPKPRVTPPPVRPRRPSKRELRQAVRIAEQHQAQQRRARQGGALVRPVVRPQARPQVRPQPRPPAWRRRRGPSWSLVVLIALGLAGAHAVWGRDASAATAGDCVYYQQQNWHLEPCALPVPWRNTANYKVLQRLEGPSAECRATPGWSFGDNTAVLRGTPPVTLCLAPVH